MKTGIFCGPESGLAHRELVELLVQEAVWDEAKHLRGFGGKWVRMLSAPDAGGGGGSAGGGGLPRTLTRALNAAELEHVTAHTLTDREGGKWSTRVVDTTHDPDAQSLDVSLDVLRNGQSVGGASRGARYEPGAGAILDLHAQDIDPDVQGLGFGSSYLAAMAQKAQAAGVARMDVVATVPGGGYAWARHGSFRLSGSRLDSQRTLLLDAFDDGIGQLEESTLAIPWPKGLREELDLIRTLIAEQKLRTIRDVARYGEQQKYQAPDFGQDSEDSWPPGSLMHAAKILLRHASWGGQWDLRA